MPEMLTEMDVLCGGGANKFATVVGLAPPNRKRFIRRASAAAGTPLLLGADFRVIDDTYLVYMGLDGTISATKFTNRDSLIVGRSVSLVSAARRTAYTGGGQFDLTRDGAGSDDTRSGCGQKVRRATDYSRSISSRNASSSAITSRSFGRPAARFTRISHGRSSSCTSWRKIVIEIVWGSKSS